MKCTVTVKALHPYKGWATFDVVIEDAKDQMDAVKQAKQQLKDYSSYTTLKVTSDELPKFAAQTPEETEQAKKQEQTSKPTFVPEKPSVPTSPPSLPPKKGL